MYATLSILLRHVVMYADVRVFVSDVSDTCSDGRQAMFQELNVCEGQVWLANVDLVASGAWLDAIRPTMVVTCAGQKRGFDNMTLYEYVHDSIARRGIAHVSFVPSFEQQPYLLHIAEAAEARAECNIFAALL